MLETSIAVGASTATPTPTPTQSRTPPPFTATPQPIVIAAGDASALQGTGAAFSVTVHGLTEAGVQAGGAEVDIIFNTAVFQVPTTPSLACTIDPRLAAFSRSVSSPGSPTLPPGFARLRLMILSTRNLVFGDGPLYTCTLPVKINAPVGATTLQAIRQNVFDRVGNVLPSSTENGTVTIILAPTFTPTATPSRSTTATITSTPTQTRTFTPVMDVCTGDCNHDQTIGADELLAAVTIVLGAAPQQSCTPLLPSTTGNVDVAALLAAVNAGLSPCGPQGGLVRQGLDALATGNVRTASRNVCQAATAEPEDDRANFYCATTRVVAKILDDTSLRSLFLRGGIQLTGDALDVCHLDLRIPAVSPVGAPRTGEALTTVRASLLPEIDAAIANLSQLPRTFQLLFTSGSLPPCMRAGASIRTVEIDDGDVAAALSGLHLLRGLIDTFSAYDADVDLQDLVNQTPQSVLANAPNLLALTSPGLLASARTSLDEALGRFEMAITSVLAETDDQSNDLLVIVPADRPDAQRTLQIVETVRQSLHGPVVLTTDLGLPQSERLNLNLFFSGSFGSLRPFLPGFDAFGDFDGAHFPDTSFGGTAPDLTQLDIENLRLRFKHILSTLPRVGRHQCSLETLAGTRAECDASAKQYSCNSVIFFIESLHDCFLDQCLCGF